MEFNVKLQELRKQKGLTQEELGEKLYVSRTAISKWESGRGYPNIDSLKCIAKFFDVTLDELLSSNELLTVAEQDNKQRQNNFIDLVFGLIDLSLAILFFLPFFAQKIGGEIYEVSLFNLTQIKWYVRASFITLVSLEIFLGAFTLAFKEIQFNFWHKNKRKISLALNLVIVGWFTICLQPYASLFVLVILVIKLLILFKK